MTEVLATLASFSVLVFVIARMLSTGLSLTMQRIIEPLMNARLVILALVGSFVLVAALAYLITLVIPPDASVRVGLILPSAAAAQNFDSDVSTYLMVIAVIGLVILMPAAGELGKRAAATEEI